MVSDKIVVILIIAIVLSLFSIVLTLSINFSSVYKALDNINSQIANQQISAKTTDTQQGQVRLVVARRPE